MGIGENIARYIYSQTDRNTPWEWLSRRDQLFYINQFYTMTVAKLQLSSGQTLEDLVNNAERSFKES